MGLQVKAIPVPSTSKHPKVPHDVLPEHEFTIGIIAPKGSGKTTLIANLLHFYKGYFHTILIFSPTVASDEKWDWVKRQKLLIENKPLKKWIEKQKNNHKSNQVVEPPPVSQELKQLVESHQETDGLIPEECFMSDYDEDTLRSLMGEQMAVVRALKKNGATKHLANRILIIFDDLVGSSLFSGKKDNPFKILNANHRHHSISIMMVSQAYKEIPKTVRIQFSCVIVFEIANEREVDAVYEENQVSLNREKWDQVYQHATDGDHNFFYINYQKPKRLRLMKNFDKVLFFKKQATLKDQGDALNTINS